MSRQTITFVLDSERDRDVLRWLAVQDNKSAAIREAIRAQLGRGSISLPDVYEAIQDLKRGGWVPGPGEQPPTGDEPPDVAATLASLGI